MTFSPTDTLEDHGIINSTGWTVLESPEVVEILAKTAKSQTLFLHKLAQEPEERLAHFADERVFYGLGKSGIRIMLDGEALVARDGKEPERACIALGDCGDPNAAGYYAFQRRPKESPGEFMIVRLTR